MKLTCCKRCHDEYMSSREAVKKRKVVDGLGKWDWINWHIVHKKCVVCRGPIEGKVYSIVVPEELFNDTNHS